MTVLTTTQLASNLVDHFVAQGITFSDSAGLKSQVATDLSNWLGGTDAVPASLAYSLTAAITQFQAELIQRYDFWNGTATGGPHGNGTYDLSMPDGTVVPLPCLAKIVQSTAKGDPGGVSFTFSTATADADPGTGKVAFNNATVASVTQIFFDNAALSAADVTAWIASFGASTTTSPKGFLYFQDVVSGGVTIFAVTGAPVSASGYRKVPVTYVSGAAPANNDRVSVVFARTGDRGAQAVTFSFSTATADADPGAGSIAFDSATFGSIAHIYVDNAEIGGAAIGAWVDTFDDSSSTAEKGLLTIAQSGSTNFAVFQVTGAIVSATGYRKIPVAPLVGTAAFPAGAVLSLSFASVGDKGDRGWSPQFALANDGNRRVLQLVGYTGGQGTAPTLGANVYVGASGLVSDITTAIDVRGVQGPKLFEAVYDTQAHLFADLAYVAGSFGLVYNDPTTANNGTYVKSGAAGAGSWVQNGSVPGFSFQPLAPETGYIAAFVDAAGRPAWMVDLSGGFVPSKLVLPDGSLAGSKLVAGSVGLVQLDPVNILPYLLKPLNAAETGFCFALLDAIGRYAAAVQPDGSVLIPKLVLGSGVVTMANLATALQQLMPQSLSAETGYVFAIVDAMNRIGFGIRTDASVTLNLSPSSIPANSVSESKLTADLDRLAVPHVGDVVEVMPDSWRGKYSTQGGPAVDTAPDGTFWVQFPNFLTRNLRGINLAGTSLQFRKTAGLHFRGKRAGAGWNPVAVASVTSTAYIGDTTNPSGLSTSGRSAGDYYRYSATTDTTFNSQTVGLGDLIVFDGSAYQVQKAPTPAASGSSTSRQPGDWWPVTTTGTFDGQTYAVGDRIVCLGFDSKSGTGNVLWYKGKASSNGDLFYNGEFSASAGSMPSSPSQGDVWQASTAGTIGALTFAVGDYAIYDQGVWGAVANAGSITVASGAMIPALSCIQSAYEWEVRRADKSATIVGVQLGARHQTAPRRALDGIICRSDSMFGVPNVPGQLGTLVAPRTVASVVRGGGTSRNVLSTYENEIVNGGDPYRAYFQFLWQGQNNQPTTVGDANWSQIIEVALKFAELFGSRDKRFCFLSILGQNNMSFNGTRLAVSQHENMFAATGALWALEQWYAANFPGQWLAPRQILLAAAAGSSIQDVRVPAAAVGGAQMTEAQTAAAYGWIPYSYFSGPQTWPFTLSSLNLVGYWSTAGLPTGGSPGDAYTRSGGGTVGNLIVNVAGTWTEYVPDITHLGSGANQGGQYLAAGLSSYLTTNIL